MDILAHYFHTTRITFGCMSKNKHKHKQQNPQSNDDSNPMLHYIQHEIHMLAHYFHAARITCGYILVIVAIYIYRSVTACNLSFKVSSVYY